MNARSLPAFIRAATWLAAPDARAEELQDRIAIAEIGDMFQVSLPVSRLVMTFPRGGFRVDLIDEEQTGHTTSASAIRSAAR